MMHWNELLSPARLGYPAPKENAPHDSRNAFEQDYSRVVFSSAVRRLQDKAQVFPLESSGYVRTRLTHSMEVSSIARSLGVSVENELIGLGKLDAGHAGSLGAILSTAGLIHDLGNPPFGHYGEEVIQRFFSAQFAKDTLGLNAAQQGDFTNFDGNAQAFRYISKIHYMYDKEGEVNGYDLTFATTATIIKYPRNSLEVDKTKGLSYKKIGYFQSETAKFEKIKEACGMGRSRHPLVFLLEAADDIAYMAADIEDGFKKGAVSLAKIREFLEANITTDEGKELLAKLDRQSTRINPAYPDSEELTVQWLRIFIQQFLIKSAINAFFTHYDAIMAGTHEEDLLKNGAAGEILEALKSLGVKHIYSHKSAVTKELAGGKALEGLLEFFTQAVLSDRKDFRSRSLYSLISPNFRFIKEQFPSTPGSLYDDLLLVTDFISGMTDSYAVDLYQRLSGIRM